MLRNRQSVRLEGLGQIMPGIDTQGRFTVRLKPDRKPRLDVRNPHDFFGEGFNRQHIDKNGDKLRAKRLLQGKHLIPAQD